MTNTLIRSVILNTVVLSLAVSGYARALKSGLVQPLLVLFLKSDL